MEFLQYKRRLTHPMAMDGGRGAVKNFTPDRPFNALLSDSRPITG
jgi:hypothetical protein